MSYKPFGSMETIEEQSNFTTDNIMQAFARRYELFKKDIEKEIDPTNLTKSQYAKELLRQNKMYKMLLLESVLHPFRDKTDKFFDRQSLECQRLLRDVLDLQEAKINGLLLGVAETSMEDILEEDITNDNTGENDV